MEDKYTERKLISLKVASARIKVAEEIRRGIITEEDLVWLINQDSCFGLEKKLTAKQKLLQEIFNSPFLLCDQPALSLNFKKLLPSILGARYTHEVEELKQMRNLGYITKEELKEQREELKFSYYYTSEEGSYILRRGHVKNVVDNVIRENKVLKI